MRTLSNKPISKEEVVTALNREIVPLIRELRKKLLEISSTDLTALQAEIDALEVDMTAVEADVSTLETDVLAVETDVLAVETDVADHETRITTLETASAAFKTTTYWQGYTSNGPGAATSYWQLDGDRNSTPNNTEENVTLLVNRPGVFKNLSFFNRTPGADTDTYDLTFRKNGVTEAAIKLTGLSAATNTLQTDTTGSVSVVKGDLVCLIQDNCPLGLGVTSRPVISIDFEET